MQRRATVPAAVTPFVGRASELASLEALLVRNDTRLVTLCGTAGVGKTRLAVELSHRLAAGASVLFLSLADVRDAGLVGSAVLDGLGIADAGAGDPVSRAAARLADDVRFLVLDNLEQLLPRASEYVLGLLEQCPGLRVVATSRRPLGLRVEQVVPVLPLGLPTAESADPTTSDAVAFLLSRLEALDPTYDWRESPQLLGDIARSVDGLPLALELAAARARVLPLDAILEGLDRPLDLLGAAGLDAPDRQRTMRDAIAWSYALLGPDSAAVFRRLGVCVGGATLSLVQELSSDLDLRPAALLDCLDELTAHCLLGRSESGRFRMLEVVREFAQEQQEEAGERLAARTGHARHLVRVLEDAAPELAGPRQLALLDALQQDAGNFSAALRFALERADVELALNLCLGLRFLWYVRGPLVEGQAFFAAALALPGATAPLRTRALLESAALARHRGELQPAMTLARQALTEARAAGDGAVLAAALMQTGFIAHLLGGYAEASELLHESLALRERDGDDLGTARVLHHLGLVAVHGDGDLPQADALQRRALTLFRRLGNSRHLATTLIALADLARRQADLRSATEHLREALDLVGRLQDGPLRSYALFTAAALAADEGRASAAVRLLGAAEDVADACGAPPWPAVSLATEQWLPHLLARYGKPRISALRSAGAAMTVPAITALAVAKEDEGDATLTRRELEVAELLGDGMTNRAIAARLVISERTVDGHVGSILSKLGLANRAQVASWMTQRRVARDD